MASTLRATLVLLLWAVAFPAVAQDLRFAYNESFAPFSYLEGGVMKGLLVEIVDEVGRRAGFTPIHEGFPWARAQSMVKSGEADALVTLDTPERRTWAQSTKLAVLTVPVVAATVKSNPRLAELNAVTRIEQTFSYPQVNYLGSGWAQLNLAKASVTYLREAEQIFRVLVSLRADLFVESELLIRYDAARLGYGSQIVILPAVFERVPFKILVSKASSRSGVLKTLDEVVREMSEDGTLAMIRARYGIRSGQ